MAYITRSAPFPTSLFDVTVDLLLFVLLPGLALFIGLRSIRRIVTARKWWVALLWVALTYAIFSLPMIVLGAAVPYLPKDFISQLAVEPPVLRAWLIAALFIMSFVAVVSFMGCMFIFFITAAIAWLSIFGLTALLYIVEYVVRRMAESKQALAALAGIFGGLALVLQWVLTPLPS